MKRLSSLLIALTVLLVLTALSPAKGARSQVETLVRVSPAEVTLAPGQSKTIEIRVENITALWAFDLELSFDETYLIVTNLVTGGFLETTTGKYSTIEESIDKGTIKYVITQIRVTDDDPLPRDGNGILIRFDITAKDKIGISPITIETADLSDRNGFPQDRNLVNGLVRIATDQDPGYQLYLPLILQ